jgi:hypothetical protein
MWPWAYLGLLYLAWFFLLFGWMDRELGLWQLRSKPVGCSARCSTCNMEAVGLGAGFVRVGDFLVVYN